MCLLIQYHLQVELNGDADYTVICMDNFYDPALAYEAVGVVC